MKTIPIIFMFCSVLLTHAQSNSQNSIIEENIELEDLPEIVITKIGDDFSFYLTDKNPDLSIQNLQNHFIAYDLGKDYEGYENYLVLMRNEKGTLTATYNQNGKLVRVVEKYENVTLPDKIIFSVFKNYPGWGIVNDKYLYTQADGDVLKKQYKLKIKNGNKTKRITLSPSGEILKD